MNLLDSLKSIDIDSADEQELEQGLQECATTAEAVQRLLWELEDYERYRHLPWARWLMDLLPRYFKGRPGTEAEGRTYFAPFHTAFWDWVMEIGAARPEPFIWPVFRHGGKSTHGEAAVVYLLGEGIRKFALFVSDTQKQADLHIENISQMLLSQEVSARYPGLGEPFMDKLERRLGWKISMVRTASGAAAYGIGLEGAARGIKFDDLRPDILALDDVDNHRDSLGTVEKKENDIARSIIAAGAPNLAIMFLQNLVHPNSIMCRTLDRTNDLLGNRKVHGPIRALENVTHELDDKGRTILTGGEPAWKGFGLKESQGLIIDMGWRYFRVECQHDVAASEGIFLADIYTPETHFIDGFEIPPGWKIDRSYDYGLGHPWGVTWWAESDGSPCKRRDGRQWTVPAGTLFAIAEIYGWTGKPNEGDRRTSEEQAIAIRDFQLKAPWGNRVLPGPADDQIWDPRDAQLSIAETMIRAAGIEWTRSHKAPGSRVAGADAIIARLRASLQTPMERPGLFIFKTCPQMHRTFQILPKSPSTDGDVDTDSEDHPWDLTRYRVYHRPREPQAVRVMA